MEITIGINTLIFLSGAVLLALLILQVVGAVYVHNQLPGENKPLAIYWELFLWVSFGSTVVGLAICAWLHTYLQ